MKATARNKELAALEQFTEEPNRFGAYRMALGFPNTYEIGMPLSEFGLLAWSLSWEMDIVNIIKALRAARIPARRAERGEGHPLVLIGGDIARMNPAALTTFADIFALGD